MLTFSKLTNGSVDLRTYANNALQLSTGDTIRDAMMAFPLPPYQGTELKLADTCHINVKELCRDLSLDLLQYSVPGSSRSDLVGSTSEPGVGRALRNDEGYWPVLVDAPGTLPLEPDAVESLAPLGVPGGNGSLDVPGEEARTDKLFPNAFKIAGLKHVCDNLLGSVLNSLPQPLGSGSVC